MLSVSHTETLPNGFFNLTNDFIESITTTSLRDIIKEKEFSDPELYKAAIRLAYLDAARTFTGIKDKLSGCDIFSDETIEQFKNYFSSNKPANFKSVHQDLCTSVQNDFKKIGYTATYGQAQKIVNMTFKYLYCAPKRKNEYNEFFKDCHMTLDSYILAWFRRTVLDAYNEEEKKAGRAKIKKEEFDKVKWSKLKDCGKKNDRFTYLWFQDKISTYMESQKTEYKKDESDEHLSPFLAEFLIWPEEQIRLAKKDLQKNIESLNKSKNYLSEKDKQDIENIIKQLNVKE